MIVLAGQYGVLYLGNTWLNLRKFDYNVFR